MAAKKAMPAWKRHELVTKAIFEALLRQDDVKSLEIERDVLIKGMAGEHRVDIFWKFEAGGLIYSTVVEVKKKKGRATKNELLILYGVVNDIPGRPKGIFVSQSGYQSGALKIARAHDITAYEIREVARDATRPHIVITVFSTIALSVKLDRMMIEGVIFIPTIVDLNLTLDEQWVAQHPEAMPASRGNEPTLGLHELRFLDDAGVERSNFRTLVQDRIRKFPQGGRVSLEVEFPEPTYLSGLPRLNKHGDPIGNVKILRLSAALDVQTKPMIVPMSSKAMATYLFKKAMETDERYVLVAEDGADIRATLSASLSGGTARSSPD